MIRIVLLGRTGNNLFQYAIGRVLAQKHGVPLVLDGSWFNAQGWSEVSHFLRLPIQAEVVRRLPLCMRALRKLSGKHYWEYSGVPILREPQGDMSFRPEFLQAPADCMLFGYFQSFRYFESIADELRDEIMRILGSERRGYSSDTRDFLHYPHSVAVHVRRGDFLHHSAFQVCGEDYYRGAIEEMRKRVGKARFFLFSDDPNWCRQRFRYSDTEVIDSGASASNPNHDLHLMSQASHHIISNSSYSWWAAWLGRKPDQVVFTPSRWFNGNIKAPIEEKLIPGWTPIMAKDEEWND